MPYIDPSRRPEIEGKAYGLGNRCVETAGELNFAITKVVLGFLERRAAAGHISYHALNEVVGVLECVKQELYRRVVVPYEEEKKEANGDVYP